MVQPNWWQRPGVLFLLVALSAVPLVWPETPPLVDVPGHIARYRVQLDLADSPDLQRYFDFHWALLANLGVDLLIIPLAPIFGLELAVKLIVLFIPPITVVGLLWIAREVHGHVPPTAIFAIPFVYGYPFNFGFINFALSLALALNAFAFWIHLSNFERFRLRAWLFIPISSLIWLTHAFGWGVLGLLAYSAELVRHQGRGIGWQKAVLRAIRSVLPLALPLLLMIVWRSGNAAGETDKFFNLFHKLYSVMSAQRDRWLIWDSLGLAVAVVLIVASFRDSRFEWSKRLAIPAAVLATAFVLMPARVFGSAYADTRLVPITIMISLLALRPKPGEPRLSNRLAWLALIFVVLRLGSNTISFMIADQQSKTFLQALNHMRRGAPVLTLAGDSCNKRWEMPRHTHLASFVVIRRDGFSNDQWQAAGAQLLRVNYARAGWFADDRSTFIFSEECMARKRANAKGRMLRDRSTAMALRDFPRDAFDYVWMIQPPDFDMKARPGLIPIWRTDDAVLYRIDHKAE